MSNCIFCKIVGKQAPANIVLEDDVVMAIVPLEQVSKGHTLLLPKKHSENVLDVDEDTFTHLSKVMRELAKKLIEENGATGMNLLNANGKDAQQSVPHLHFHLVPRFPNGGLDMWIKQNL